MPRLFHVSESGPLATMSPRPAPAGTPYEGRRWVWAVDEPHLPNYLLPRDCPRVCWAPVPHAPAVLAAPTRRVIAIEHDWLPYLVNARLHVHELEPSGFAPLDTGAGYWVSDSDADVRRASVLENCVTALAAHEVELRLSASLWPYVDALAGTDCEFSAIRLRNARPRGTG